MKMEEWIKTAGDQVPEGNALICDDFGIPSVMVPFGPFASGDLHPDLRGETHPAFLVHGKKVKKVWISKYQNVLYEGRAYSVPGEAPATHISFDEAAEVCRKKGTGWGLMPASLWAAVALWSKKQQTLPHGNSHYGQDYFHPEEKGIPALKSAFRPSVTVLTATGSGPLTWNHNHGADGICDLNGNVFEWQAGLRTVQGEIQVIPDADCMDPAVSMAKNSSDWRAMDRFGNYIPAGSKHSLKTDFGDVLSPSYFWTDEEKLTSAMNTARYCEFRKLGSRLPEVPARLKELMLYPADARGSYGRDYFYTANALGEGIAMRGGAFSSDHFGGIFTTGMNMLRTELSPYIGFRSVYYELS